MKNKLIEKAAKYHRHQRRTYTTDEIELALAWLSGDVGYSALCKVTNKSGSHACGFIATALRWAFDNGQLEINKGYKNYPKEHGY